MKNNIIWLVLSYFIIATVLFTSCSKSTLTSTTTTTVSSTKTSTTIFTTTSTTTSTLTTIQTTRTKVNWWDKLGTPQYGGELVIRIPSDIVNFDPINSTGLNSISSAWMEKLTADDWTVDPTVFDYKIQFRPTQYIKGLLAESWEMPTPDTYILHLRKGIRWQDIPPASGREFVADDVVFHYNRLFGLGGGFTKPSPYWGTVAFWKPLMSVTATDKYTVVFKWSITNPEIILENQQGPTPSNDVENPEAVKLWGDLSDWHHAIGTGPFVLSDFVSGASATLVKNPSYWGYDERYPQNKLPYIDKLKILIIPDFTTALAALRTGKIDFIDGLSLQQTQLVQKSSPEILMVPVPIARGPTVNPRNDVAPFKDIRVRKAMQMAIDLSSIAKSYYGGSADPYPATLTSIYLKGWGFPYNQWPQDLKDEYAFNPTAAKKLLADAGYPTGFKTNVVADSAADLDLLQIVKSYFADIGIDMEIRTMDSASWVGFVSSGRKYDQLAYSSLGLLSYSYEPTKQFPAFLTGNASNYVMVSDPVFDAFNTKVAAANTLDDVKQVLIEANQYIARQHFVISLLQPNLFGLYQPWLKGFNGQNQSLSGTNGPKLLAFYASRFWIDQKLKTSMGH